MLELEKFPIAFVDPLMVASFVPVIPVESDPKNTVPKSESGRTPEPLEGASAIHSAEDRFADETFAERENVLPVLSLVSFTVNVLPE